MTTREGRKNQERTGGVVPPADLVARVRALLSRHGANYLARLWGCGRELPLRIAARQPIRRGSLLLVEQNLRDMGAQAA